MGEIIEDAVAGDPSRYDRDSGVIGEKKTIRPLKIFREETTGSTFRMPDRGNFSTPQVTGNVAKFDLGMKSFEFEGIGWRYRTQNYWSSADETKERVAALVNLESPDRKTLIYVHAVDLPVTSPLGTHSMTLEQERNVQELGLAEDSFVGDESIIAAQQAVEWYLNQNVSGYIISKEDTPIHFTTENINSKAFVKAEFDVLNKKGNAIKRSILWAYNYRTFWLYDGKKHIWTWISQVITDPAEYADATAKARQIPETAEFKKYGPYKQPEKRIPGVTYLNYRGEAI